MELTRSLFCLAILATTCLAETKSSTRDNVASAFGKKPTSKSPPPPPSADLFVQTPDMPDYVKRQIANMTAGSAQMTFSMNAARRSYRRGSYSNTDQCHIVWRSVPRHLTFITRYNYYRKYTHAYNIPVVSSGRVSDAGLKRACYVLRFLLADREVLRKYLYLNFGRLGVLAPNEGTGTTIPEHRHLGAWWDGRARGLGGTLGIPISTGGEENLLCSRGDRYPREDIFLHEFSHGIQGIAVAGGGIPGFMRRLQAAYYRAKRYGLWRNTYAMSTKEEYFGEGTQSYFQVNNYAPRPNGIHGPVNTRAKLMKYDLTLYNLVREVFPCGNSIWKRCEAVKRGSKMPPFYMDCDVKGKRKQIARKSNGQLYEVGKKGGKKGGKKTGGGGGEPPPPPPPTEQPPTGGSCTNKNGYCRSWARSGYCNQRHTSFSYMKLNCRKSCRLCKGTPKPRNCNDGSNSCSSWARKGECRRNPRYMKVNCKKSCNVC